MTLALAIVQIIIPLIPKVEGEVSSLVNWISSIRTAAKQTGQWSDEMEQNFRASVIAAGLADPAYKP